MCGIIKNLPDVNRSKSIGFPTEKDLSSDQGMKNRDFY